eukprot:359219-Chlamydomonas_euryale.AAC.23
MLASPLLNIQRRHCSQHSALSRADVKLKDLGASGTLQPMHKYIYCLHILSTCDIKRHQAHV